MPNYLTAISELFKQKSFPPNPANCVHDLLDNKKIILYGAGDAGITFFVRVLWEYGLKADAVLDRKFKSGDTYFGVPAFSPYKYKPTKKEQEDSVVVITVGKKEHYQEIESCLHDLRFKNIIKAVDIYEFQLFHTPPDLKKKGFKYYLDHKKKIIACLDLFTDDISREVYTRFLQTHLQRKPVDIPCRRLSEQYFPKDITLKKGYARFINCGAYNGDTVRELNTLFGKVDAVACFEPDVANYQLLTEYLDKSYDKIAESVITFPCGVYSHETQLHFSGGILGSSTISPKGKTFIQCVALDHALPGFKPTFIDMDIEGAELEALKGAEKLIRKNQPDLAICVYHLPPQIWEIPLYLESLKLGYHFYLRNYTSFTNETVLYATT